MAPRDSDTATTVTTPLILAIQGMSLDDFLGPIDLDVAPETGKLSSVFVLADHGRTLDRFDSFGNLLESIPFGHGGRALDVDAAGNIHLLGYGWIGTLSPSGEVLSEFHFPNVITDPTFSGSLSGIAFSEATGTTFTMEWTSSSVLYDPDAVARILELDSQGNVLRLWTSDVVGFDLDGAGHLVALDPKHEALEVFDLRGSLLASYSVPQGFTEQGTAICATPDRVILAGNAGILILDRRNGAISQVGLDPDGLPYLAGSRGILSMPDGSFLVVNRAGFTKSILRFSPEGAYLGVWGPVSPPGEFAYTYRIRALADGSAMVFDVGFGRFTHFSASGNALDAWGGTGYRLNQFLYPYFDVGNDGSVWTLERGPVLPGSSPVRRFGMDGTLLTRWDVEPGAFEIEADGDGHVWVATHEALLSYDSEGRILRKVSGFYRYPFHRVDGFTLGDDGCFVVADTGRHRLVLADSDGRVQQEWPFPYPSNRDYNLRVDAWDRVYVASPGLGKSIVFAPGEDPMLWTGSLNINDIDVDPTGRIWLATSGAIQIREPIPMKGGS